MHFSVKVLLLFFQWNSITLATAARELLGQWGEMPPQLYTCSGKVLLCTQRHLLWICFEG